MDWDFVHEKIHISKPKYATKAIKQLLHPTKKMRNSPYQYTLPQYGAKSQYAKTPEESPLLEDKEKNTFLYHRRAINPTILVAIYALATEQAKLT